MFACYDSEADIAWFPTGESDNVLSERVPGGLRDCDLATELDQARELLGTARPPLREVA